MKIAASIAAACLLLVGSAWGFGGMGQAGNSYQTYNSYAWTADPTTLYGPNADGSFNIWTFGGITNWWSGTNRIVDLLYAYIQSQGVGTNAVPATRQITLHTQAGTQSGTLATDLVFTVVGTSTADVQQIVISLNATNPVPMAVYLVGPQSNQLALKQDQIYAPPGDFVTDGAGSLAAYTGTQAVVSIPPVIYGVPTTNILAGTFSAITGIRAIVIPDSVLSIGDGNFYGCSNLRAVRLPTYLKWLGVSTFGQCTNLAFINMPPGLTSIGPFSFQNCTSLTSIQFPATLTNIDSQAFSGCGNLTSIYFNGPAPHVAFSALSTTPSQVYYLSGYGATFGTMLDSRPTAMYGALVANTIVLNGGTNILADSNGVFHITALQSGDTNALWTATTGLVTSATGTLWTATTGLVVTTSNALQNQINQAITNNEANATVGGNFTVNGVANINGDTVIRGSLYVTNVVVSNLVQTSSNLVIAGDITNANLLIARNGFLFSGGSAVSTSSVVIITNTPALAGVVSGGGSTFGIGTNTPFDAQGTATAAANGLWVATTGLVATTSNALSVTLNPATWSQYWATNAVTFSNVNLTALSVMPITNMTTSLGTTGNWVQLCCSYDGTIVYAGNAYPNSLSPLTAGIYKSTNSGATWNLVYNTTGMGNFPYGLCCSSNGQTVYMSGYNGSISGKISFDGGSTWGNSFGNLGLYLACMSGNGTNIGVLDPNDSRVYWTTNDWTGNFISPAYTLSATAVADSYDGTKAYITQPGYAILASTNSAVTFTAAGGYNAAYNWTDLKCSPDGRYVVVCSTHAISSSSYAQANVLVNSTYGTGVWTTCTGAGTTNWASVAISADGQKIVAVPSTPGYVTYSADGGTTWVNLGTTGVFNYAVMSTDGKTIYLLTGGGFLTKVYVSLTSVQSSINGFSNTNWDKAITALQPADTNALWIQTTKTYVPTNDPTYLGIVTQTFSMVFGSNLSTVVNGSTTTVHVVGLTTVATNNDGTLVTNVNAALLNGYTAAQLSSPTIYYIWGASNGPLAGTELADLTNPTLQPPHTNIANTVTNGQLLGAYSVNQAQLPPAFPAGEVDVYANIYRTGNSTTRTIQGVLQIIDADGVTVLGTYTNSGTVVCPTTLSSPAVPICVIPVGMSYALTNGAGARRNVKATFSALSGWAGSETLYSLSEDSYPTKFAFPFTMSGVFALQSNMLAAQAAITNLQATAVLTNGTTGVINLQTATELQGPSPVLGNEYDVPTVQWTRQRFDGQTNYYAATNVNLVNTNYYLFTNAAPVISTNRAYVAVTNNQILGEVMTQDRFTRIDPYPTSDAYMNYSGSGSVSLRALLWYSYDGTNFTFIGQSNRANLTTNATLTTFEITSPLIVATNSAGFYIKRQFAVVATSGTVTVYFWLGGATVSHIAFNTFASGADLTAVNGALQANGSIPWAANENAGGYSLTNAAQVNAGTSTVFAANASEFEVTVPYLQQGWVRWGGDANWRLGKDNAPQIDGYTKYHVTSSSLDGFMSGGDKQGWTWGNRNGKSVFEIGSTGVFVDASLYMGTNAAPWMVADTDGNLYNQGALVATQTYVTNQLVNVITNVMGLSFRTNTVVTQVGSTYFVDVFSALADGSTFLSSWAGATNTLYIVSPNKLYTNLLMTTHN